MVICSYSYSEETALKIINYINNEEYLTNNIKEKLQGFKDIEVTSNSELNKQLNDIANNEFRTLKQLQTLIKCNALIRGDNKVIQHDVNEIIRLSKFINLTYSKI